MQELEKKEMTEETATKLISDFLDAFSITISFICPRISRCIYNPEIDTEFRKYELTSILTIKEFDGVFIQQPGANDVSIRTHILHVTNEEFIETNTIKASFKNRDFKIVIYDSPDDFGYNSMLDTDYDPDSYLAVDIIELRADGSKKYEMFFGFDVIKMQFLELFQLDHCNQVGIIREPKSIDNLEKKFTGKKFFQVQVKHI